MSVVVVDQSQFIVYVFDQEVEPVLFLSFEVDPEEGFFHAFRCEGGEAAFPVIDRLGYRCDKSDPEYPGDEWLKFLEFNFNEEGKLVNYYEVKVPYPVPH